jgi:glycosyltransferase involved in cell wall biosynthesis
MPQTKKIKLDVVIPVLNEFEDLPKNLPRLKDFLEKNMSNYEWRIVIADNGSSQEAEKQSEALAKKYSKVVALSVHPKGRGRALKYSWTKSDADILTYMDVDLSSQLEYFPKLVEAIAGGEYDLAIGSRNSRGSKVYGRPLLREITSRGYALLIRLTFLHTHIPDAQCGFKAISREVARNIVPRIVDNAWFFDSELLICAEKAGYRIKALPIEWKDDPNSTVKVLKTAWEDIKGLFRIRIQEPWNAFPKPSSKN